LCLRVAWLKGSGVSEELSAVIFIIKCSGENAAGYFYNLKEGDSRLLRSNGNYLPNFGPTSQKTVIFISTAARASNLTSLYVCVTLYE
jgi:hypothetical protein